MYNMHNIKYMRLSVATYDKEDKIKSGLFKIEVDFLIYKIEIQR